jgi:putative CocE/NonD family hydrolase
MAKIFYTLFVLSFFIGTNAQNTDTVTLYQKKTIMVPMRDGVRLFTVILAPVYQKSELPFLITRTPYGADIPVKEGTVFSLSSASNFATLAKSGYIFVLQDIRGKYKSEGTMQIHQPITHLQDKKAVDESTDTYDTVDWLTKNIKNNNNKAGIFGVSYPGWLALVGAIDPHPSLKASSEQACMGDLFLGDDFHHNGAFRLSYGMEYSYEVEHDKTTDSDFPFPQYDLFNWYLKLGSLKNVNDNYFKRTIPTWNNFSEHPNYDTFWQKNSTLSYVRGAEIPQLHVGGYFDQEDMNGPQLMYQFMEKNDSNAHNNYIILGPWNHGQWSRAKADSLGKISFESNTAAYFQQLQKQWFDFWLKGIGDGKFNEATCFQTGSNQWKTYSSWPPKETEIKNLYVHQNNTASFIKPTATNAAVKYISDPAKPIPYRALPIEATYGPGSRWRPWHVEDQRFVTSRPDVVSFSTDTLTDDITVTGQIKAHVIASTTGTDADFVVKLIDVYPDIDKKSLSMSGYELPVAMEVFRGRFRKSFEKPEPFVPNKPEEIVIDLHQINHTFKKGHQIMVQIQSSWFPVIDRNPQKFVANIFEAKESDFIKAEHTIYCSNKLSTFIELPVSKLQ